MLHTTSAPSLDTLPTEVQCSIFRLLGPVGLISASQTCKSFRGIINPERRHFVERLLALECLEEHGGPSAIFRARDNALQPNWDDEKWESMRWACTGCLRLLPHRHFDNHSLLRLGYRKPVIGSPAVLTPSSREPSGKIISDAARKRRRDAERRELKMLKRRYAIATTLNWGQPRQGHSLGARLRTFHEAGMEEFLNMSLEEFEKLNTFEEAALLDRVAWSVERLRRGFKRRLRKCNECRFQQGSLRSHTETSRSVQHQTRVNLGTKTVPIVISRRLTFGTYLERYFPTACAELGLPKPDCGDAPVFTIYRHGAHERFFTIYMIRCPQCARWLEMRAYRCGGRWPKWWPACRHRWGTQFKNWDKTPVNEEFINSMRCNSCYAAEHGEDKLSQTLAEWFHLLADIQIRELEYMLNYGWSSVWGSVDPSISSKRIEIPRKYHFQVRSEVLAGLPWKDYDDKFRGIDYERADLQLLNKKHKLWVQLLPKWYEKPEPTSLHWPDFVDWFECWMDGYDRLEANWVWLRKCEEELKEKPKILAEWALRNEIHRGLSDGGP
ncbi:hypothetical protein DL769_004649 [Monosporascus sp. CRB-8-3]|nr:hypothetical protein DL769_004649 [Monosporascus sp. CRB-8-3]